MSRATLLPMFLAEFRRDARWRWGVYGFLLAAVAMLAQILFVEVPKMKDQRRHAAEIRALGESGLAAVELYAGGHMSGLVPCATVTDPATLDRLSRLLATTRTSIALDRMTALYEFTIVTVDGAGGRINFVGTVVDFESGPAHGERYEDNVFIRYAYMGTATGFRLETWGYPVRIPGLAPWVVRTFTESGCPAKGV